MWRAPNHGHPSSPKAIPTLLREPARLSPVLAGQRRGWSRYHSDSQFATVLQGNAECKGRKAMREVGCSVKRIDNPSITLCRTRVYGSDHRLGVSVRSTFQGSGLVLCETLAGMPTQTDRKFPGASAPIKRKV